MVRHFIGFLFLLAFTNIFAQPKLKTDWLFLLDGYNTTDLADLDVDAQGNTYVAANYSSDLQIPELKKKLPHGNHVAGMFMKLDKKGKALWAHAISSAFDCRIRDITIAPDGDLILTGFCDGITAFPSAGDTLKLGKKKDPKDFHQPQFLFISRYSPAGVRRWAKVFSHILGEGISIAVNSKNEIYWSFYSLGVLKEGGKVIDSLPGAFKKRIHVLKLDRQGNILDRLPIHYVIVSESEIVRGPILAVDKQDNLIICGAFNRKIMLSPNDSLTNDGYYDGIDAYIAKYNSAGTFMWYRRFGGRNSQLINDVAINKEGRISVTGSYSYECILSQHLSVIQKSLYEWKLGDSFFYCQFAPDGKPDFVKYYNQKGYGSYCMGSSLAGDSNGYTYVTGNFTDTLDFGTRHKPIIAPNYPTFGFTSLWYKDSLLALEKEIKDNKSWAMINRIRIGNRQLSYGGFYYGGGEIRISSGRKVAFSTKDYGRATFICGSVIPDLPAPAKDSLHMSDHLENLQAMVNCLVPEQQPDPAVWFPVPEEDVSSPTQPVENTPCGIRLDSCQAVLYPNPAIHSSTLKLSGASGPCLLEVISSGGALLFSQQVNVIENEQYFELNLQDASAGTYFISITLPAYRKVLKLVKTN